MTSPRLVTYETLLAQSSLRVFFAHVGLLVLYSLRTRRWNFLQRTMDYEYASIRGKGLFVGILRRMLEYMDMDLFSSSGKELDAEAGKCIDEMVESELISESCEVLHGGYQRKSYVITQKGVDMFESQIRPFLPTPLLSLAERIHSKQEDFKGNNADSVLRCLTKLMDGTPIEEGKLGIGIQYERK